MDAFLNLPGLGARVLHRGRLTALLAALAIGMLFTPAKAEFGPPISIANKLGDPQVAVDADGNAVFAWMDNYRIEARTLSAAGVLGPVLGLSISHASAQRPQVAVNAAGAAVFAWMRLENHRPIIEARTLSAAGVLGPILILSGDARARSVFPDVAIDASGNCVFVWERQIDQGTRSRVEARTLSAAGVLGAIRTLTKSGEEGYIPQVAMDADGNSVVVWKGGPVDAAISNIQARTLSAAGVLGAVQNLSEGVETSNYPQIAMNAAGEAVVVWGYFRRAYQARRLSTSGVLGPIQNIPRAHRVRVAVRANGDAVFAWDRRQQIQTRTLSAAGVFSPTLTLSAAGRSVYGADIGVDADGDAVFGWTRYDDASHRWIQARTLSAKGTLGPIQTLYKTGDTTATLSWIAAGGHGNAVAVWRVNAFTQALAAVGP